MIDFLDDIGDLIFGNKRYESLKHFANSKQFQIRKKVKAEKLPIEVQRMQFYEGKKRKSIKGYLFKKDLEFNSFNQIFDYQYSGDLGTSTTTIFLFDCDSLELPSFIIKPKGGFGKLGSIFSSSEWSNVSSEFDKGFGVESSNMNFMRTTVTIQFAEVMLGLKNFTVEGAGSYLVLYNRNSKVDIVDMDNVYDSGKELMDIIINDHSSEIV
ncbi:MAG: hypothetical protein P1U56_15185 [Saprospiraceae bacterium]|nr:hypothetical protein [Saprospiraceae bacterium]